MISPDDDWLTERFQEHRLMLRAMAYRMLGSTNDADDALQEAWLRLHRSGPDAVENVAAWLTSVVAGVCLEMLRSRKARLEEEPDADGPEPGVSADEVVPPAIPADAMGPALLVGLEALAPGERVAFVLHDQFGLPFDEIAPILGRTPAAVRQLAGRARGRVRGAVGRHTDRAQERRIVEAFLRASRAGDFDALLALMDPEVVLRADEATVRLGSTRETRGASPVAATFRGRARFARLALLDGIVGAVWAPGGIPRVAFTFTIVDRRIVAIDLTAAAEQLRQLDVFPLEGR